MYGDNARVIGLDVGGTSVKGALVDRNGQLAAPVQIFSVPSTGSAGEILDRFGEILQELTSTYPVVGLGVGMPGPFDYVTGTSQMRGLAKYDAIYGINLADDWRHRLDLPTTFPIRFSNDAAAFALGESLYGQGRGLPRVMAITLGTGCGGAFVVNGSVVTEGEGVPRGGEVYHLPLRAGMIEDLVSRRGLLKLWADAFPGRQGLDVKDLAQAALAGDPEAGELFSRFSQVLAEALLPVAVAFRPDCMVIGGQIALSLPLFAEPLRQGLVALNCNLAASGDLAAGVRGAASLLW